MSKNANLTTLRKKTLQSLIVYNSNKKTTLKSIQFIKFFNYYLLKRGYIITQATLLSTNNICKLKLSIFITSKIIAKFIKKKTYPTKTNINIINKNHTTDYCDSTYTNIETSIESFPLIFKNLPNEQLPLTFHHEVFTKDKLSSKSIFINNYLSAKNLLFKLNVLNKYLKKTPSKFFNRIMKRYQKILFSRRHLFYKDFVKILSLLYVKNIHAATILHIFSKLFQFLPKKRHNLYFKFLQLLARIAVTFRPKRQKNVLAAKGIKIRLNGRIKGKLRSSTYFLIQGNIPNQTIEKDIEYAFEPIFTPRYGAFGIHLWILK